MQLFSVLVLGLLLGCFTTMCAAFGNKKKDKEPQMPKGADAAALGIQGLAANVMKGGSEDFFGDLMKDLEDPEILAEVEKLMKDKKFVKEMKKYTDDPEFKKVMEEAQQIMQDPEAMAEMSRQAAEYAKLLQMEDKQDKLNKGNGPRASRPVRA